MFISTTEAAKLVGRSKSTIKRWASLQYDDPSSRPMIRRQPMPFGGYKYMIYKDHLVKSFPPLDVQNIAPKNIDQLGELSVNALKELLADKERYIMKLERLNDQQSAIIDKLFTHSK
jgi:hypothetical protein